MIERAVVNDAEWVMEHCPSEESTWVLLSDGTEQGCVLDEDLRRLNRIPRVGRLLVQRRRVSSEEDSDFAGGEARLKV